MRFLEWHYFLFNCGSIVSFPVWHQQQQFLSKLFAFALYSIVTYLGIFFAMQDSKLHALQFLITQATVRWQCFREPNVLVPFLLDTAYTLHTIVIVIGGGRFCAEQRRHFAGRSVASTVQKN